MDEPVRRVRLALNDLTRKAMDQATFSRAYWKLRSQQAPLRSRLGQLALANPRVNRWYWSYRDWRVRR